MVFVRSRTTSLADVSAMALHCVVSVALHRKCFLNNSVWVRTEHLHWQPKFPKLVVHNHSFAVKRYSQFRGEVVIMETNLIAFP
jgi:hypothetical protein